MTRFGFEVGEVIPLLSSIFYYHLYFVPPLRFFFFNSYVRADYAWEISEAVLLQTQRCSPREGSRKFRSSLTFKSTIDEIIRRRGIFPR